MPLPAKLWPLLAGAAIALLFTSAPSSTAPEVTTVQPAPDNAEVERLRRKVKRLESRLTRANERERARVAADLAAASAALVAAGGDAGDANDDAADDPPVASGGAVDAPDDTDSTNETE